MISFQLILEFSDYLLVLKVLILGNYGQILPAVATATKQRTAPKLRVHNISAGVQQNSMGEGQIRNLYIIFEAIRNVESAAYVVKGFLD